MTQECAFGVPFALMADDVQVLVDGAEEAKAPPRSRPQLALIAGGLVVGVVIGAVFFSPIVSRDTTTTTTSAESAASPSEPTDIGTTGVIPGFIDALVAVAAGDTDSLIHLLWPRAGALQEHPMFSGESVTFDATAQHIAVTETVPDMEGVILSVGRYNSIQPAASGVTSFAFHDLAAKHLGYTTMEQGVWTLWHMTPDLQSQKVAAGLVPDGRLVAWGDWGWAIQSGAEVVLLNPKGELRTTHQGLALTSTPDGWILVAGDELEFVSAGGGVRGVGVSAGIVGPGPIVDASISPNEDLVAISGREKLVVVPVDEPTGSPASQFDLLSAEGITWTTDGKFLLVPTRAGLLLLDPDSGTISRILAGYSLLAVDVIPPSSS